MNAPYLHICTLKQLIITKAGVNVVGVYISVNKCLVSTPSNAFATQA